MLLYKEGGRWTTPEHRPRNSCSELGLNGTADSHCPRTRRKHDGRKHLDTAVDPRIERSRQLILHAALEELGDVGYGAFTVESVAARSGVAKSTIYRHWSDKLALIADAFQSFHEQWGPDITSGSSREKLDRIVRHVAEVVGKSVFSACIPALPRTCRRRGPTEIASLGRVCHRCPGRRAPVVRSPP